MQSISTFSSGGCFAMGREYLNHHGGSPGSHNRAGIQPTAAPTPVQTSCGEETLHVDPSQQQGVRPEHKAHMCP